jgi:AMMECR1 domain-containing protein
MKSYEKFPSLSELELDDIDVDVKFLYNKEEITIKKVCSTEGSQDKSYLYFLAVEAGFIGQFNEQELASLTNLINKKGA